MYEFYISYVIMWCRILFVWYFMKKKKAKFLLKSKELEQKEDILIEKQEQIIYFSLKDNSKNRLSIQDKILTRETEEILLELDFKNSKNSLIYLKKEHLEYRLDIKVVEYEIKMPQIKIRYILNNEEYLFEIIIEGE